MKKIISILILLTIGLIQTSTVLADSELEAFKAAIRAKYDMKEAAFANNDPAPILEKFYTSDVISVGPDGTMHQGTEGIRPVYEEVITGDVKVESYYTHVNGNAGWDWVNFHVTPAEADVKPFSFKMLFLWEKINGDWMSKGEMYVMGAFGSEKH